MKKYCFEYKKIITLFVAAFIAIPSMLNAQNFVDGVVDSVIITPINLTTFAGKKIEKNVQLNWTTATEKNNSHFNIQRSNDGINFENITKIMGKGNSSTINNYTYTDINVPNNNLYYRLQQVDVNGKSTLSAVILIKYGIKANVELSIYPNPVVNHTAIITLKDAPIGQYKLSVKIIKGETVFVKNINQTVVNNSVEIQLPTSIAKGFYVLNVASIDGRINLTQKIVIE
jgi:hypothetical protein